MADAAPQSRRALSRESCALPSRTSTFADFLSDGSEDEDEDEDDAHSRATLRMQQADDWVYADSSLKLPTSDGRNSNHSFCLNMAKPGVFETNDDGGWGGPKKVVEQALASKMETAAENKSLGHTQASFSDEMSFTGAHTVDYGTDHHDSLASSLPSFDADDDSFFDEPKPSFSDEHSFVYDDSFTTIDTSFVYRPSLLDDDEVEVQGKDVVWSNNSYANRPSLLDASLSPSVLSISQEVVAGKVPTQVSTARYGVDNKTPVPTYKSVSKTANHTPKRTATYGSGDRPAQGATDTNESVANLYLSAIKPVLSRQSSATSSSRFSQQRMATSHESWRMSSESKYAFDEEVGQLQSPRASAVHVRSEQQSHRLSSTFEERNSAASTSSNSPSFTSFHSQVNFFVDDIPQSVLPVCSSSLDSRPSGDSFTNVAILGDDARDQNERRSSDIIPHNAGKLCSNNVSALYPTASGDLDRSYSDLVDATVGLDHTSSKSVDHEGINSIDGNGSSANISSNGTSLGNSLALSAESQSSAASDELHFLSFDSTKPAISTDAIKQLKQRRPEEQRSLTTATGIPDRQKAAYEEGQAMYRSIVLPCGSDVNTGKPSTSASATSSAYSTGGAGFSSAALLAAIKTRDVRADTRSEEREEGDVALGTLPQLAPPLKNILVPRGRGSLSSSLLSSSSAGSSPSNLASFLSMSSRTRSSVASSTGTADRLDFTGVYLGSLNSPKSSSNNGISSRHIRSEAETMLIRSQKKSQGERKDMHSYECLGVKLDRSKSDGRAMQLEARRKVENFFQTSQLDIGGQELHRATNRKTRARTTVVQYVDNVAEGPRSFACHSTKVTKIIDLKNLRNDGKRPGCHLQYDAIPLTPQQESTKQRTRGMTTRTTSTGTTATRSIPSDHIPMPRNYMVSPQGADALELNMHAMETVHTSQFKTAAHASGGERNGFFLVPSGPGRDDGSRFRATSQQRANESPAFSPSPFATSFATSTGFGESEIGPSPGKSPVVFAATSSAFFWKPGSSFNGLNESAAFDTSQVLSQRFRFVDRVQNLSASVASSLRRLMHSKDSCWQNGNANPTSPRSQCTAPVALPRTYNHNGFYEIPFKVPDLNKPLPQREKQQLVESHRDWLRQWLILVACAVFGLSVGVILVVILNANIFNLSATEAYDRQESNGELVLAVGLRWFLLPGHLFLQAWSAVVTPLLICYVVNAISDLVGCADKASLVLSFRSIGYAMMLAMVATVEGVLAMWMTRKFGWFRGSSSTASSEVSILSDGIGVTPLPVGAVGLLCTGDGEYLRRLDHDVFACSNASLLLPLYEEVSTNSTDISNSGPAVFALQELTRVFATPTSTMAYYPASLGTGGKMITSLLLALTPDNLAARYTEVASDGIAPLGGLVMFALLLGYLCGKRILRLRRDGKAAMFESVKTNDPATEDPHKARHYIVGLLVELQLALEWIVRPMERYLAPAGFFSIMLGHVVAHHREWHSFTSPMSSLIVGVLVLFVLHTVLVLPMVLKQFSSSRHRLPLLTTTRAFVPAFLFAITTDNVALSAPVMMQCYARVLTVTRSAAQATTAVTAAVTQNARALYLPLAMLWLLETSSSEELELSIFDYFTIGMVSMLSCFCGGSTRLTLTLVRTLWSIQSSNPASALPATMPLLVVCDMVLSRFASVVSVADHFVFTQLASQHWGETVVHGPINSLSTRNILSASPLDDSHFPRPPSSAMMSSVCL